MYLRCHKRLKDGKEHRYWSVVESVRTKRGVHQRQLLYLGEINDAQRAQWCSALDVFDDSSHSFRQMSLFPDDRVPPAQATNPVQIRLGQMTLHHPRQWGGCWLAMELWNRLDLDRFWAPRLPRSRKGTDWLHVLKTLVGYCLLDPGSEWRLHCDWFKNSAMGDLLAADESVAAKDTLYRCLDKLCAHKADLFSFLKERWSNLFGASYDVLLYDLTSTYFECDPPEEMEKGLRRFGYSRDKRSDCVQVVIALVVTPNTFHFSLNRQKLRKAPGLTPRAILEKFKTIQMIDVYLPTTDGRNLILPRYTQPAKDLQLLLHHLNLTLPDQPPPQLEEHKKEK
jgi:hypothetical protein